MLLPALAPNRTCLHRAMLVFQLLLGALAAPTPNFAQLLLGFDVEDGPEGAGAPCCQALVVFCMTFIKKCQLLTPLRDAATRLRVMRLASV